MAYASSSMACRGYFFICIIALWALAGLAIVSPAILYALLVPNMSGRRAFTIGEAYGMGLVA